MIKRTILKSWVKLSYQIQGIEIMKIIDWIISFNSHILNMCVIFMSYPQRANHTQG